MNEVSTLPARHKIDVDVYRRMAELGLLGENPRVELIEGNVIDMVPIGQGHSGTVNWLNEALVLACHSKAIVSVQNPVRLDRFNEPQPDFAVLRHRTDDYADGERAGRSDVLLLIEVADSSLADDRGTKRPLYARHGIGEYWIVDLRNRVVEACRAPGAEGYGESDTYRAPTGVRLALAPEIEVDLGLNFRV